MRDGGPGSHSIPEDKRCVDLVRKSLAEWCYRALGGELPPRVARPCDCSKRAPPETSPFRVRVLLSRGSHASWTRKGNAEAQTSLRDTWSRAFLRSTRRAASPLRSGGLIRRPKALSLYFSLYILRVLGVDVVCKGRSGRVQRTCA